MDTALDRWKTGIETEVSAKKFQGQTIFNRDSRFFCPECYEQVFWRSESYDRRRPAYFAHAKKTESSKECDKRIISNANLQLHERIGLPVYLLTEGEGQFSLNIGFPALGEQLLGKASAQKTTVNIINKKGKSQRFPVDPINFLETSTTLIPVDFVPILSNYQIVVENGNTIPEISRKWANFADGFMVEGALFTCNDSNGKKIKRGDSVTFNRQYFLVAKSFLPPAGIIVQRAGKISLNHSNWTVYSLEIYRPKKEVQFKSLESYLWKTFGVTLLETPPELIPLWPPVIEQDSLRTSNGAPRLFCSILSGNEQPNVFSYNSGKVFSYSGSTKNQTSESNVSRLPINKDLNGNKSIELRISSKELIISVDRKYLGRETIFSRGMPAKSDFFYDFSFEKKDGSSIDLDNFFSKDISDELTVNSNAKFDLFIGSQGKIFHRTPLRKETSLITTRRDPKEIFITIEDAIFYHYKANKPIKDSPTNNKVIIEEIQKHSYGIRVPVPRWVTFSINEYKKMGAMDIVQAIRAAIANQKIFIGVLNVLAMKRY